MILLGPKFELPNAGNGIVSMSCLLCIVLNHLMTRTTPVSENETFPLASCLKGSKEALVCGNKLDSLKKEKKLSTICTSKKKVLQSHSKLSQAVITFVKAG